MTDDEHLAAFEDLTLPIDQWNHRAHVRVAHALLRRYPFTEALLRMRAGIKAYNARNGVPEGPTSGYNETTTHAFLHLIAATLYAYRDAIPTCHADQFCDTHPQLMTRHALRLFYSPRQRTHPSAKIEFVPPDLAPLPKIISATIALNGDGADKSIAVRLMDERPAANALSQIVHVFREARRGRLSFLLDMHDDHEDGKYLSEVLARDNEMWLSECDDQIVGFIAFANGWVNQLYVAPAFQGLGIGTQLLAVAQRTAPSLQLWAFEANAPAIEFYLSRGFTVVRRTDGRTNEAKRPDVLMKWVRPLPHTR